MDNWYLLTVTLMPFLVVTKLKNVSDHVSNIFYYHLKIISDYRLLLKMAENVFR